MKNWPDWYNIFLPGGWHSDETNQNNTRHIQPVVCWNGKNMLQKERV